MTNRPFRLRLPRRKVVLGTVIALGLLPVLLVLIGMGLDYDDGQPAGQNLLILDDIAEVLEASAGALADDPQTTLWIVDRRPLRSVRIGAIASVSETHLKDLTHRNVNLDQCRVLQTDAVTSHDMIRALVSHEETTGLHFTAMVSSARGRYWRNVIQQALSPEDAARFHVSSHVTPFLSPTGWFRNRRGGKIVLHQWLDLLFVMIVGESHIDPTDPYADVFDVPDEPDHG